jgi:glycosyltransferase involved in cell wall biosynthesis
MPLVSVVIPTFNRSRKVTRAISSVLGQSYPGAQVIVVDDGSADDTPAALEPFRDEIEYLRLPSNLGVSAARNRGIRQATAPLIAFLDSDDYWLPEKLSVQVAFFEAHPDIRICQTDEIWIRRGRRVNPRKKHLKPSGDIFESSLRLCLVSPSAVMLRRSLLDEVGGFDESLPVCEDYDLWLRIACRYPVPLIREPLVIKEGGASDQLSARYRGMDRFRIRAIEKLIRSGILSGEQKRAAFEALALKCRIYGKGCLKRGKEAEARAYLTLPRRLQESLTAAGEPAPSDDSFVSPH